VKRGGVILIIFGLFGGIQAEVGGAASFVAGFYRDDRGQ